MEANVTDVNFINTAILCYWEMRKPWRCAWWRTECCCYVPAFILLT